jgi:RIO-like serine/threonine protein kinase
VFLRIVAIFLALGVFAIDAQKAEPSRIRFAPGATRATVKGVLQDRQQHEYVLNANQGQRMELQLASSPHGSSVLKMLLPGGAEIPLEEVAANRWRVVLQETGEFVIIVRRTTEKRGRSEFSLRVDVR